MEAAVKEEAVCVVGESDLEIDEEHFSINNVEVRLEERETVVSDDEEIVLVKQEEQEVHSDKEEEEEDGFMLVDLPELEETIPLDGGEEKLEAKDETVKAGGQERAGVGSLQCEICELQLTSILNFSTHMRKYHKDSEQEKNKPFQCETCSQGFYFQSSLNSHKSKAHKV